MPVIVTCDVVSETGNVVVRDVAFKEGYGRRGIIREVCNEYAPTKVSTKIRMVRISLLDDTCLPNPPQRLISNKTTDQ